MEKINFLTLNSIKTVIYQILTKLISMRFNSNPNLQATQTKTDTMERALSKVYSVLYNSSQSNTIKQTKCQFLKILDNKSCFIQTLPQSSKVKMFTVTIQNANSLRLSNTITLPSQCLHF